MLEIILLVIFIILSSFFSGTEIAFMSVPYVRLEYLVQKQRKNATLLKQLRDEKEKTLITILIGNNIVNIGASALATKLALDLFGNLGVSIATGIMTFILLLFGEITPKAYCANHAERVALKTAPLLYFLTKILWPFVAFFTFLLKFLQPLLGEKSVTDVITEDEIKSIVEKSEGKGVINPLEKEVITNIFRFDDLIAEDVMVPRAHIFALEAHQKVKEILPLIKEKGFSRIPVYDKEFDRMIGALYVKDLLAVDLNTPLKKLVREVLIFPETKKIEDLFREMKRQRKHLSLLVDEYGVITGLLTIEDLIEEIVGEIYDETDPVHKNIIKINDHLWTIKGDTEMREITKKLKIKLAKEEDENETISSIILRALGKIPEENESLFLGKRYKLTVKKCSQNRIGSVLLEIQGKRNSKKRKKKKKQNTSSKK